MKILFILLLTCSCVAQATSKISPPPRENEVAPCVLIARFIEAKGIKLMGGPGQEKRFQNAVYWDLEVAESVPASCVSERNISLRIRSADFKGDGPTVAITYPVDVEAPSPDQKLRIKARFIQGRDTYLNRKISEWVFLGRLND